MTKPFPECQKCPRLDEKLVPSRVPDGKVRLTVVGDFPTRNDAAEGKPFTGQAGRLVGNALQRTCGLGPEQVAYTNAVLCGGDEKTLAGARKCCQRRLKSEVAAWGADVTLALGGTALQSALGVSKKPAIQRYRGSVISKSDPIRGPNAVDTIILSSLPPLFVSRVEQWANIFWADMARVGRVLQKGFIPPEEQPGVQILIMKDLETLVRELKTLGQEVVADIETVEADGTNKGHKGPDIHTNRMTCFVLADTMKALVIPWSKTLSGRGKFWNGHEKKVKRLINRALRKRTVVTHNGQAYDHIGLQRRGFEIKAWEDTLLAYHVITSHFPKRLDHVASCYLDVPPWKQWDHGENLETLWHYCGRDGLYTARAKQAMWSELDERDLDVYRSDKESAQTCRIMSTTGFMFDRERAKDISELLRKEELRLIEECSALADMPGLNVDSPKQLRKAFFQNLGAHVCFRGKSGDPSLNKDALRAYAASANEKLARMSLAVIECRSAAKCRRTYVDSVKVHEDGRVRPTWMSTGTISGRWACKGPNLANLYKPQRDPAKSIGGIRSLYTASPGHMLVSFDVGQGEFRVAAYLAGDENMIAMCAPGQDVHWNNAKLIFGIPMEMPRQKGDPALEDLRNLAKNAGFAVCYLAEVGTVHQRVIGDGGKASFDEVDSMLRSLRKNFAGYFEFQAELLNKTIRLGYVESPILGRKRWLGHNPEPPANANFPIQSGLADAMNLKIEKMMRLIHERKIRAKPVAMVYDAVYFDTLEEDVPKMEALIQEVYAEPIVLGGRELVLPVDMHTGFRWSDL